MFRSLYLMIFVGGVIGCSGVFQPEAQQPASAVAPASTTANVGYGDYLAEHHCMNCDWLPKDALSVVSDAHLDGPYAPSNVLDDDRATAWCEGVQGAGVGETLVFRFSRFESW